MCEYHIYIVQSNTNLYNSHKCPKLKIICWTKMLFCWFLKIQDGASGPVSAGKLGSQLDDHWMTDSSISMSFLSLNDTTFGQPDD